MRKHTFLIIMICLTCFISCNKKTEHIENELPQRDIRFYFFAYLCEAPTLGEYIIFKNRSPDHIVKEYRTQNVALLFIERYKDYKAFSYIDFPDDLIDSLATGKKIFSFDTTFLTMANRCIEIKIDSTAKKIFTMDEQEFFRKYVKKYDKRNILDPPDNIDYGVFIKYLFDRNYLIHSGEDPIIKKFDEKKRDEFLQRKKDWKPYAE